MPFPTTTLLLSTKIILISVGAISIAMAIKFSVPSVVAFAFCQLPMIWNALLTWLRPPYLYFVINGIIITIAASSRFNHHRVNNSVPLISSRTPPQSDVVAAAALAEREAELDGNAVEAPPSPVLEVYEVEAEDKEINEIDVVELKPVVVNGVLQFTDAEDDAANDDWMVAESSFTPPQRIASPESSQLENLLLPAKEKPLFSSRLGHRKTIKKTGHEGGRAARAAKPKEQEETLESMWKKITEGRHLKQSDTWENHGREVVVNALDYDDDDLAPRHVLKSATFRERNNYEVLPLPPANLPPIPAKIKKEELSLSQDELNRRVEAFIKKFNEDMRLQRQESHNRYMEMINRGAY